MRFEYEAKRNLATGHTAETNYEIVILGELIDPLYRHTRVDNESWDGTAEAELQFLATEWTIRTDLIDEGQDLENFREFIASVAGGPGEPFTFDPESEQPGVDVAARLVWMKSKQIRESRPVPGKRQFSFTVREV